MNDNHAILGHLWKSSLNYKNMLSEDNLKQNVQEFKLPNPYP